jgi:hypothetical protein
MLLGIEAFTSLITDHYIKDVAIHNNIILNTTTGISIWQGIYSFLQRGIFSGIDIRHNTITGQRGRKAAIGLSYETLFGDPAPNVVFSGLRIHGNILSAHPDSLNNGRLLTAPLNPQPGLQASYNMWNLPPGPGFNQTTDQSQPLLPDLGSQCPILYHFCQAWMIRHLSFNVPRHRISWKICSACPEIFRPPGCRGPGGSTIFLLPLNRKRPYGFTRIQQTARSRSATTRR